MITSNRPSKSKNGLQKPFVLRAILRLAFPVLWTAMSAASVQAASMALDRIAVVVNRDVITLVELNDQIDGYLSLKGVRAKPGSSGFQKIRREVIDSMIQEILLAQEADKLGVSVAEADIDKEVSDQMESVRKRFGSQKEFEIALKKEGINEEDLRAEQKRRLARQMKAQRALAAKREEAQSKSVAPEADVKARYEKNPLEFDTVRFSMIYFRIPEDAPKGYAAEAKKQAAELKAQIEAGGDFAALARKYSEDTLSADKGGDMGEMIRGQIQEMDPALARQFGKFPLKQINLLGTTQGVYLVRVDSKRKGNYQEAAPLIRRMLQGGQQVDVIQSWIQELRDKAYIRENK